MILHLSMHKKNPIPLKLDSKELVEFFNMKSKLTELKNSSENKLLLELQDNSIDSYCNVMLDRIKACQVA